MPGYKAVPVEAAREIASRYDKSIVVILSWDRVFDNLHTTTYGREASDKLGASKLGDLVTAAAGADMTKRTFHEDFRRLGAAEWAVEKELLLDRIKELESKGERERGE